MNQALCDMLGRDAAELMHMPPEELFAQEYRDSIHARIYSRPRGGLGHFEMELLNRRGERIPVLINTFTQVNTDGEPEFGAAFVRDRHFVWTNKAFRQGMLGYGPGDLDRTVEPPHLSFSRTVGGAEAAHPPDPH